MGELQEANAGDYKEGSTVISNKYVVNPLSRHVEPDLGWSWDSIYG